jgi:hypothetical protein
LPCWPAFFGVFGNQMHLAVFVFSVLAFQIRER